MSTLTSSVTPAVTMLLATALAFSPIDASGQQAVPPNRGGFTTSMGLPPTWIWSMGATAGVNREDGNEATINVHGGFYHDILNPVTSALGLMGEAYVGRRGSFDSFGEGFDGGARLGLFMPVIRLGLGADYNIPDLEFDFFLSLIHPLQRGGIFVNGGSLRVNYWPGRHHSTAIGFDFPVGAPFLGTSRPRNDHVTLRDADPSVIPFSPSSDLLTLTGSLEDIGLWIDRLTVPFTDQWDGDKDEALDMFIQDMGEIRSHLTGQGPWY